VLIKMDVLAEPHQGIWGGSSLGPVPALNSLEAFSSAIECMCECVHGFVWLSACVT